MAEKSVEEEMEFLSAEEGADILGEHTMRSEIPGRGGPSESSAIQPQSSLGGTPVVPSDAQQSGGRTGSEIGGGPPLLALANVPLRGLPVAGEEKSIESQDSRACVGQTVVNESPSTLMDAEMQQVPETPPEASVSRGQEDLVRTQALQAELDLMIDTDRDMESEREDFEDSEEGGSASNASMAESLRCSPKGKLSPAAWKKKLQAPLTEVFQWVQSKPYEDNDLVKLWAYLVARIRLPKVAAKKNLNKYGQKETFKLLTRAKDVMVGVLKEATSVPVETAGRMKAESLMATEKILGFRCLKNTKSLYPEWLKEDEMIRLLQDVWRYWNAKKGEQGGSGEDPPFLHGCEETAVQIVTEDFVDWLFRLIAVLKQRRRGKKEEEEEEFQRKRTQFFSRQRRRRGTLLWSESDDDERRSVCESDGNDLRSPITQQGTPSLEGSPQTGEERRRGKRHTPRKGEKGKRAPYRKLQWTEEGRGNEKGEKGSQPASLGDRPSSWGSQLDLTEDQKGEPKPDGGEGEMEKVREDSKGSGEAGEKKVEQGTGSLLSDPPTPKEAEPRTEVPDRPSETQLDVNLPDTDNDSTAPRKDLAPPDERANSRNASETLDGLSYLTAGSEQPGAGAGQVGAGAVRKRTRQPVKDSVSTEDAQHKKDLPLPPHGNEGGKGEPPKTQREPQPARFSSYASAASRGRGPGDREGETRRGGGNQVPYADLWEDEAFLEQFFRQMPEECNPRQRFVARLRYRGQDENKLTRKYIAVDFLEKFLSFPKDGILAIIIPPGIKEIDICFTSEAAYQLFWELCRAALGVNPSFLQDFNIVPLFRGESKVLTVTFRTTVVPEEDLTLWLNQRCKVLLQPEKKRDEWGFWTGEFKAVIALDRDPYTGQIRHLPKYFFMGADRGITRYSGQPPACFQCGGFDHIRQHCLTELCSKCGVRGHRTSVCARGVTCSLCSKPGHAYRFCPESVINVRFPDLYQRDLEKAREAQFQDQARAQRYAANREQEGSGPQANEDDVPETPEGEREERGETHVPTQREDGWETVNRRQRSGRGGRAKYQEWRSRQGEWANSFQLLQEDREISGAEDNQAEIPNEQHSQGEGSKEQPGSRKRQGDTNHSYSPARKEGGERDSASRRSGRREGKKVRLDPPSPKGATAPSLTQLCKDRDRKLKELNDAESFLNLWRRRMREDPCSDKAYEIQKLEREVENIFQNINWLDKEVHKVRREENERKKAPKQGDRTRGEGENAGGTAGTEEGAPSAETERAATPPPSDPPEGDTGGLSNTPDRGSDDHPPQQSRATPQEATSPGGVEIEEIEESMESQASPLLFSQGGI